MGELITESLQIYNLPLTVLLVVLLGYWLMVSFGFLDTDSFDVSGDVDADVDVDMEVGMDADADLGIDGGHGHDFDLDYEAQTDAHAHEGGHESGGVFMAFLRFVNVSEVPLMIIISILTVLLWGFSLVLNHYLNPLDSILIASALFVGNFIVSVLLTKVITQPLRPVMRVLKKDYDANDPVVGSVCIIKTGSVTRTDGQAEITTSGSPILIQARTPDGTDPIPRGSSALVIDYDRDRDTYLVKPISNNPN